MDVDSSLRWNGSLIPNPLFAQVLRERNCHVVITGASGWLGQATLSYLGSVFGDTLARRVFCFGSISRQLLVNGYLIEQKPMDKLADLPLEPNTLVCHFAFLTKELAGGMSAKDYIDKNRHIRDTVLSILKNGHVAGVCIPSSGAVYDALGEMSRDPSANLYGQLKLDDEKIFSEAAISSGWTFVCPRIFNLSGPYINKFSSYALSSFIYDCLLGRNVEIKSAIPVWRSYFFIGNLLDIIFGVFLKASSEIHAGFDTAGERDIELSDLAKLVIERCGHSYQNILRPSIEGTRENRYIGSPDVQMALQRRLGLSSLPLLQQIDITADYMRRKLIDLNL